MERNMQLEKTKIPELAPEIRVNASRSRLQIMTAMPALSQLFSRK